MIQRKWHLPDTIGLICMKLQRLWQYSKTCINSRLTKIPEWKREGEVDKSPTPIQEATCSWYLLREIHLFYSIAETLGISATLQLGLILRSFVVVYFFSFWEKEQVWWLGKNYMSWGKEKYDQYTWCEILNIKT